MRSILIFTVVAMALGMTTTAFADPPATTPTATTPTAQASAVAAPAVKKKREPKPDDMICEENASVTGSMLSHKVCMTRAQRDAQSDRSQRDMQNNASSSLGRPSTVK